MRLAALRFIAALWLLGWASLVSADVTVPQLKARVTDLAGMLQGGEAAALEQQLAALETKKGSQVAILIVPTTQPEAIEQYALRVVEKWKLGRKGVNDGALILVAKDDRKLRIEVGYGLEGVIPDAVAKRIIAETITPLFKQKQFHAGLDAGVKQIAGLLDGEQLPPPQAAQSSPGESDGGDGWWILLFFLALGTSRLMRSAFGQFGGAALIGGAVGAAAWFFTQIVVIGLVAAFAGFLIALLSASGSSGWSGGSGSGGGWSSGGGSDSGFSGGGGDFGGGGASGDW